MKDALRVGDKDSVCLVRKALNMVSYFVPWIQSICFVIFFILALFTESCTTFSQRKLQCVTTIAPIAKGLHASRVARLHYNIDIL